MSGFTINQSYAKHYDTFRRKEELQKAKDRGINFAGSDESSSDESESEVANIKPKQKKEFLDVMAAIKRGDPKLLDKDTKFFQSDDESSSDDEEKTSKSKPLHLRDMDRDVMLNRQGKYDDDSDGEDFLKMKSTPYEEEQKLKADFLAAAAAGDDEDEDFMTIKKSSAADEAAEASTDILKEVDEYWRDDKKLTTKDKFLRDYMLKSKYLVDDEDSGDDDVDEAEEEFFYNKQEEHELDYMYQYRSQNPDTEYIKSYPRTVPNSVRDTEQKKKNKRQAKRQRKEEEKTRRDEEIKRLKNLKREEITAKLEQLRESAGVSVDFNDADVEADFDPATHNQRMNELFEEEFYKGEVDAEKPVFSDDEDAGQVYADEGTTEEPNWDEYNGDGPAADHEDFCMDADYEENVRKRKESRPLTKKEKRRLKKSKFSNAVQEEKPGFATVDKTYQEYLDEYYEIGHSDMVAGMPCRFKYQQTGANDFGLTIDEVFQGDRATLNSWCSIKKVVQQRNDYEEDKMLKKYAKKSRYGKSKHFAHLQRKIKNADKEAAAEGDGKKKKKKKTKTPKAAEAPETSAAVGESEKKKKKKKKAPKVVTEPEAAAGESKTAETVVNGEVAEKKKKTKKRKAPKQPIVADEASGEAQVSKKPKLEKKKKHQKEANGSSGKKKKAGEIDAKRLKAYGL